MGSKYPFLYPLETPIDQSVITPLKNWLKYQEHLPKISDEFIYMLYLMRQPSLEQSKKIIEMHMTIRSLLPEIYANRDPKSHQKSYSKLLITEFQGLNSKGENIIMVGLRDKNYIFDFVDMCKAFIICLEGFLARQTKIPKGVVVIVDMTNITLSLFHKVNLTIVKKLYIFIQDALHVRTAGIYLINTPSYMDKIMSILKPFLGKWFVELIHFFDSPTEFADEIPLKYFPSDYGGEKDSFIKQTEDFQEYLMNEFRLFLLEADPFLEIDEKKRSGKMISSGQIFGLEGSIRMLEFD